MKKRLTIAQIMKRNRSISRMPCVGDIRRGHVVVSISAGHVMAVPRGRAVKFTVQEWNDLKTEQDKPTK